MHSSLGLIVVSAFPLLSAYLFSRLDRVTAVIWTILGAYLWLPPVVAIDLPMIPPLDKDSVAALSALAGVLILGTGSRPAPPWSRSTLALLGLAILSPFLTAITNPTPLVEGVSFRPGLGLYDGFTGAVGTLVDVIPFVLGYMLLSTADAARRWLWALVVAALVYSLPMLLEIRMSPQLNVWIYGFFAHDFSQMMRYGGFRPMVFLSHGLWVAIFAVSATMACATLIRDRAPKPRLTLSLVYLMVVLILCKSLASILYGLIFVPLILFASLRLLILLSGGLALMVFLYPLARWFDLVPTEDLVAMFTAIDPDRGSSLEFRLRNETMLLDRTAQKPLAGWGGWNRNHIVDPEDGRTVTVTDGAWIVQMSAMGMAGYLWMFGLLVTPLVALARNARRHSADAATAGLAIILAANLVDLVPNATLTALTWMTAGALAGLVARRQDAQDDSPAAFGSERLPSRGRQPLRTVI